MNNDMMTSEIKEKLLAETYDNIELFLYEGILKQNDIPYIIRQKGMGSFMRILGGQTSLSHPAGIYVDESEYNRAADLTEVIRTEGNQAPDNKENPAYKKKNIFAWVIVSMFVLMIVIALVTGAFKV